MWEEEYNYRVDKFLNTWIRAIYKDNGLGWEEVENNEDYPFATEEELQEDFEDFKKEKRKKNDDGWRYRAVFLGKNKMKYEGCNDANENQFLYIDPNTDEFKYSVSDFLKKYHDKDVYGDEDGINYLRYKYSGRNEFV